jgi:hypothetical protein
MDPLGLLPYASVHAFSFLLSMQNSSRNVVNPTVFQTAWARYIAASLGLVIFTCETDALKGSNHSDPPDPPFSLQMSLNFSRVIQLSECEDILRIYYI